MTYLFLLCSPTLVCNFLSVIILLGREKMFYILLAQTGDCWLAVDFCRDPRDMATVRYAFKHFINCGTKKRFKINKGTL